MVLLRILLLLIAVIFVYPLGYFVLSHSHQHSLPQPSWPSAKGVVAYIINLDRSPQRYSYVKPKVAALNLPFERISAVEGSSLSQPQLAAKVDLPAYQQFLGHRPRLGTIGCSLSHINTWQKFLDSNYEFAVIFEDDISFDAEKLGPVIQELTLNSKAWDIASFEISHHGNPLTIKTLGNGQKLVIYLTEIAHSGAYIINRHAAYQLLAKALPIKMPIDHYFTRSWEFGLKFTGIENPRLVTQSFGDSDIAVSNKLEHNHHNTIGNSIKHCIYKLQSYLIRFAYNLMVYVKS